MGLSTNPIITEDVEHDNRVHAKKNWNLNWTTFAEISGKNQKFIFTLQTGNPLYVPGQIKQVTT